jgi:hypothetical protein
MIGSFHAVQWPRLLQALLVLAAVTLPAARTVAAEDEAAETEVREATAEQLPALQQALEAAGKAKKSAEALEALRALAGLKHPQLEKGLLRLLRHAEPAVALHAAGLLELRAYPAWKGLWAASWGQAVNDKRPALRAKVLRAFGRIGLVLDKKQLDEVEAQWRWTLGNPARTNAPQLVDIAFYVEQVKEKRFARWLAENIDEPIATNPNDPNTPPVSWWEERWHLWNESKAGTHAAIKALTGQDFASTAQAKEWIEANRRLGFDW